MTTPQDIRIARRELGRKLAELRSAARLRQEDLARLVFTSRSTIANTETGHQVSARDFWEKCDTIVDANGALVAAYEQFRTLEDLYRRQETETRQQHGWYKENLVSVADVLAASTTPMGVSSPDRSVSAPHAEDVNGPMGWSIDQAADESLAFAAKAAANLDTQSTADMFEQVTTIARQYADHHRWRTFLRARQVRDLVFELSGHTRRPTDLVDIYLLAALSSLLMSSAAFDLGQPAAALGLTRAARTFSALSGHRETHAWTCGLLATLLNWQNQPHNALVHIEAALSTSNAAGRYRLQHIAARSHALIGDRRAAEHALSQAAQHHPQDSRGDLLQDQIGGEFRFDHARAAACVGATWLHLNDGAQAERRLRQALDAHQTLPPTHRSTAPINGARVDLATAYLLAGDLQAAQETIEPIFQLPGTQRISTISGRLAQMRRRLRQLAGQASARRLDEQISGWAQAAPETAIGAG